MPYLYVKSYSALSKEDIGAILDCPHETGYTYANSISYKPFLGSKDYIHPRLCRPRSRPISLSIHSNEKRENKSLNQCAFLLLGFGFVFFLFSALFFADYLIQCQGELNSCATKKEHAVIDARGQFLLLGNNLTRANMEYHREEIHEIRKQFKKDSATNGFFKANNISMLKHVIHQCPKNITALQIYQQQPLEVKAYEMALRPVSDDFCPVELQKIKVLDNGFCIANITKTKRTYWWTVEAVEMKINSFNYWIPLEKLKSHHVQVRNLKILFSFSLPLQFF